jgi:RNase P subunit RPR2
MERFLLDLAACSNQRSEVKEIKKMTKIDDRNPEDSGKEKINLEKIKQKGYKFYAAVRILPNTKYVECILCNRFDIVGATAIWEDPKHKRAVLYFLCRDCAEDFFNLPESMQVTISRKIEVIINKRSAQVDGNPLPRLKLSELLRLGNI